MDHDDDDELARALAASLQDSHPPQRQDEDEDSEDQFQAELQRAIEASKAASQPPSQPEPVPVAAQPAATVFLSERAQLEKARLERQKRLRGDIDEEVKEDVRPAKRQQLSSSRGTRFNNASNSPIAGPSKAASSGEEIFWDGEVRQTGNIYADAKKDTKPNFRLTDIIGDTSSISFAIISSYATDWEFAFKRFDADNVPTPVICVSHPAGDDRKPGIKYVKQHWIRTQPYLHTPFSSMHMKFMLIFYKTGRLRIMISTANLVDYDWKSIENSAWVQDIPLRSKQIAHDPKAVDFPALFQDVLKALNVKPALDSFRQSDHPDVPIQFIEELRRKWDFSKVKVHLVPSISGKHEQWPNVIKIGHPRLMKVVRDLGARAGPSKDLYLECQGSSVGKLTKKWIKEFYHSTRGADAQNWLKKSGRSKTDRLPWPGERMKILFPSKETVKSSVLGEPGGGTIFAKRSDWDSAGYPRELFHDSVSKRGRVLMHSKMILGTLKPVKSDKGIYFDGDTETEDDSDIEIIGEKKATGWIYVGSHNFTISAWGSYQEKSTAFTPIFSVANYELGVVIPLYSEKEANEIACWERPAKSYAQRDAEPWMQGESAHHSR